MALLDLLGRRWALRVLWELRDERRTFRALQDACDGVSPAVLNDRVRELRENGLIDAGEGEGYGLTPMGRELLGHLAPMTVWAERWAAGIAKRHR